jgi:putative membrane protein (TIGR04086 family)
MRAVKSSFNNINKKAVKGVFFGALSGIIITILLTILSSLLIIAIGKLSDGAVNYISLIILALGSLAGGYISTRIRKSQGILMGFATGLVMFIIVFAVGLYSFTGNFSVYILIKTMVIIVFSIIGAVIGISRKEKQRYKK